MKEKLFIRLNRRIKRFLLNLATKYIRHCAKDSNYIKYAINEFNIAYDVEVIEDRRYLKEEVEDFKDGIYKKELMDRIELMKRHMYCKDKPSTFKE